MSMRRPWVPLPKTRDNERDPYYHTPDWRRRRKAHIQKEPFCRACTNAGRFGIMGYVVDHIIPRKKGGSDEEDNLQTLCRSCHDSKSAKDK